MAKKVSRRKMPPKEEFQLKERVKIESEVFDRRALLNLARLIKKGIISTVDYPVSTGKEANVFRATAPGGQYLAVKIYKIETAPFFRKSRYLEGDPRFKKIKHTDWEIVKAFARKEYKNLEICAKANVHAPRPYYVIDNIVVMGFLGRGDLPFPTMDLAGTRGESDLDMILNDMRKMYRAGLVHADVSEYNVMQGEVPYLIDFGQGVVAGHPYAEKFLERDVEVILKYFAKYGIKKDPKKTLEWIKQ